MAKKTDPLYPEVENKTPVKDNGIEVWRGIKIPDSMLKDAFPALTLAILNEFFLSSYTKYFIFQGMLSNLEKMNYSEEEIEEFRKAINQCYANFHKPNGFMG